MTGYLVDEIKKKTAYLVRMSRSGSYIHNAYLVGYLVATEI